MQEIVKAKSKVEEEILGYMFLNIDICQTLKDLKEEHFGVGYYGATFNYLLDCHLNGHDVDLDVASNLFQSPDAFRRWMLEVIEFDGRRGYCDNLERLEKKLIGLYRRLQGSYALMASLTKMGDLSFDGLMSTELIETANKIETKSSDEPLNSSQLFLQAYDKLDEAVDRYANGSIVEISTGLKSLDVKTGGYNRGSMTVIGAATSIGKSAFMLKSSMDIAKNGQNTIFYSLEDPLDNFTRRMWTMETGLAGVKLATGNISPVEHQKLEIKTAKLVKALSNQYMSYITDCELSSVLFRIQRDCAKYKPDAIFIDYIQQIEVSGESRGSTSQITATTKAISNLAAKLNIAIIAGSQLRKKQAKPGENPDDTPPNLTDLRGSGSVGHDSYMILLLHRDRKDHTKPAYIDIVKIKQGNPQMVLARFDPLRGCFIDNEMFRETSPQGVLV